MVARKNTHYEIQPRQRLTTDALNQQDAWTSRQANEVARRLLRADIGNMSGVISGLLVSVIAATMQVSVGAGLALYYDSTIEDPDSQHQWVELRDAGATVLTLDPGGANPRWDVIEIAPGVVDGDADILDVWDPQLGVPVPTLLAPLKVGTPVVTVRKGTEAAAPKFPAGVDGVIPLAYVYVGAGVVALNVDRVVYCRPILTPRRGVYRNEPTNDIFSPYFENHNISGGGWAVAADGFDGTLAAAMTGTFPNGGLPFSLPGNTNISLITGNYEGGGLPAGNTVVHAYVAPPPYPTGYSTSLGPRELYLRDVTIPNCSTTISAGARNCIVLVSSSGPSLTSPLGQRGGPNSNTNTFTDNLWGAFTHIRSNLLYIGAAFHAIAVPGLITQRVKGATVAPARKTGFDFEADLPIAAPTVYNLWGNITGDAAMQLPETATKCHMSAAFDNDGGGHLHMKLEDDWTGQSSLGVVAITHYNDAASTFRGGGTFVLQPSSSGSVTVTQAAAQLIDGEQRMHVRAYEDIILAMR